jgi:alpha-methylacyl-CoA racemase
MEKQHEPPGPLAGLKVLEFSALGPVPFCAMLLADMGAEVVHVARPGPARDASEDVTLRGRRMIPLDLKQESERQTARELAIHADVLLEGHRPGVMERLGLGPETLCAANPRLIYARMTGWGQDGPLAKTAGHDINFIALSGALHAIGTAGGPVPPLNLVGDYGGGALFLAFGVLCAVIEMRASGRGQVIDGAMIDGAALLMAQSYTQLARGSWSARRGDNPLDGGAPWYTTYETSDGKYVAVGAIEEKFWRELLARLGIEPATLPAREKREHWATTKEVLARAFRQRSREEWTQLFRGTDACVTPVLELSESAGDVHLKARGCFAEIQGTTHPAPAPRLSRTPGRIRATLAEPGTANEVLREWGVGLSVPGTLRS